MTSWVPHIAERSGPVYLAIAEAIAADTASGRLRAGTRLPTHRDLADRLRVTVGTITRGYAEAARRGLISGEVGRGTFARGAAPDATASGPATARAALIDLSSTTRRLAEGPVALSKGAGRAGPALDFTGLRLRADGGAPPTARPGRLGDGWGHPQPSRCWCRAAASTP